MFPTLVKATKQHIATSNINGVNVNWTYELNESNEIINLTCSNPSELTGNITTPATLDGKNVVAIGYEGAVKKLSIQKEIERNFGQSPKFRSINS